MYKLEKQMEEDERFLAWMREIDNRMIKEYGVGIDDIPEMPWTEWYNEMIAADEAIKYAIEKVNNEDF